jgi:hypothetical protein
LRPAQFGDLSQWASAAAMALKAVATVTKIDVEYNSLLRQSTPVFSLRIQKPGPPSTTGMVGRAA